MTHSEDSLHPPAPVTGGRQVNGAAAKFIPALIQFAWAFFLFSLPVTSFPYLPQAMGGGALVRPLAIYPLIVLTLLAVLPRLWKGPLPRTLLALLPFILAALASSLLSLLGGIEPALGVTPAERIVRALFTLGLGCAMYAAIILTPRSLDELRGGLRWMYAGFGVAMAWAALQAVYVVHFTNEWYQVMNRLQRFVSIRRLIHNRISGMTYEPNWFAEQLTFMLMPWLLASVLTGQSAFRWRWRFVTLEWFLLAGAVAQTPLTFSRAGVMNLAALAVVGVLLFRFKPGSRNKENRPRWRRVAWRAAEIGVVLALLGSLVYVAGAKNEFFARIWGYWGKKNATLEGYFEYLGFGARFTYSETAFRIYEGSPWFGVGLGNYAFYFEENLPERPLAYTPEVLRIITPEEGRDRLITSKNLYFRLLAETGLVGTAAFAAFFLAVLGCAVYLWLSPDPAQHYWGMGGLLGLVTFLLAALSFDSFALPNMWVVFGLITSAAWQAREYCPKIEETKT